VYPLLALAALTPACTHEQDETEDESALIDGIDPETIRAQANSLLGRLPNELTSAKYSLSEAKIALGRQLYFEKRLSKNQDLSCNTCHALDDFGVDRRGTGKTSLGHRNQLGTRNSPTVYNAARQLAQFWDGRAADVEEQAKGPIINPVEMAMRDAAAVEALITSIPGYAPLFKSAFPSVAKPITYANAAIAIGAFERRLVSKDRFDRYLAGESGQLNATEKHGLNLFMTVGCTDCHNGPGIGGAEFQKLGVVKGYTTTDDGRFDVTGREVDRYVFKVPSLRNVAETAPYFHDGSQATLKDAIGVMAEYQTTRGKLNPSDIGAIASFLDTLTGELPTAYIAEPATLPPSTTTPKPNPN
jgi:cytochrome c peroxidase